MSVMYFLQVDLDIEYTENSINYVLKKMYEKGCVFLAKEDGQGGLIGSYFLNLDQASAKIFMATDEVRYLCEDTLFVKCKDTYFDLRFYKEKENLLLISLSDFPCAWGKKFWNGQKDFVIDFSRYINFIINVTKDLSLLGLEMSSDHSAGWPEDIEKKSIIAVVCLGPMDHQISGSSEGVRGSVSCIITNGNENNIIFFDEKTGQPTAPPIQKYYNILKAGFPAYLYAKKDNIAFKVEIKQNVQGYDGVTVYPLEPYLMKKGYGSEEEKIDVAFYVERLLELCENFAIYELKTFF
jgi:hypothetical protein